MANFLCVTARYLSRAYEGEEWPPSPARLFQALIAGAKLGEHQRSWKESEEALRWLQTLGPPTIVCSQGVRGEGYLSYGPLNQMDELIPSRGRPPSFEAFPPFGVPPSFAPLPSKKKGKSWTGYLDAVRHRPTVLLDEQPAVHYLWRIDGGEDLARRVCKLAEWMVALGWGTDLVVGEGRILSEEEVGKLYGQRLLPVDQPRGSFEEYHVPAEGFLELVLERFEKKRFDETRSAAPEVYSGRATRVCTYRGLSESWGPMRWYIPFALIHPREDRRMAFGVHRWTEIVAWARHAVAERLRGVKGEDWISEHVLGHGSSGAHVCFVPIPSLPHDGLVRRLMIVGQEPGVYRALRENLRGTLTLLEEGTGKPAARLRVLGTGEDPYLNRFVSPGGTWITASPLILHGYDYRGRKYSVEKTQKLILQALQESGYEVGRIRRVWFQKSPLFPGAQHVLEYRVPAHLKPWPRYHVGVEFEGSVLGPVIAGIGQHYGFGTFLCGTGAEEERV
jgi:CRISPR-associated protein Csb2